MEVLRNKHLNACPPSVARLDTYTGRPPDLVSVDIPDKTVTKVAGSLSGGSGIGETDLVSLQHWLLRFGAEIGELRLTVEDFVE